jgi:hypothetical protein
VENRVPHVFDVTHKNRPVVPQLRVQFVYFLLVAPLEPSMMVAGSAGIASIIKNISKDTQMIMGTINRILRIT